MLRAHWIMRAVAAVVVGSVAADARAESRQASGVKVGEVTSNSAIIWMRLTEKATYFKDGIVPTARKGNIADPIEKGVKVSDLKGYCPGAEGRVRVRYSPNEDLGEAKSTEWVAVSADRDFTHQFHLEGLKPETVYHFLAETSSIDGKTIHDPLRGRFETAPPPDKPRDLLFTVSTCQSYRDLDDPEGFKIYAAMLAQKPQFFVATGDNVYYDNDPPRATTPELARFHWHRMYSLPRLVEFHRNVGSFWEKDDHDTVSNDTWPGRKDEKMLPMTFEQGQKIFLEQVPMGERTYRRVRWGKGVEAWLIEVRDFRSPNTDPDGPDKTILGKEQLKWLQDTMKSSDAVWKLVISPTPMVGPDRVKKGDNHANAAFATEGAALRKWLADTLGDATVVICGDRHWQYHSIDPTTKLHEFSVGPASDEHAAGSPGQDDTYHQFHRMKGGYLSVAVRFDNDECKLTLRHHDVDGKVVHEHARSRPTR
jgi:alkaline phosphatase D